MALFPVPMYKHTVVAIDGKAGVVLTNARGEHQALLPRAAADYENYYDADGNPILGPVSLCEAEYVDLCTKDICNFCEKVCILVPEALAGTPAGTPLFVDEYVEPVPPAPAPAIPDVALAGAVQIGSVAEVEMCDSPSYWDNSANLQTDANIPDGYIWMDVEMLPSALAALL